MYFHKGTRRSSDLSRSLIKMILEAEEAGCKAIGGAGMLLQQGAVNYELFVGKEMPLAEYQEFQKAQAK